jgi:hypothetical protein
MSNTISRPIGSAATVLVSMLMASAAAWAQAPAAPAAQPLAAMVAERVAALKQSLATSAATLKQYEWIETTTIRLNGEEKAKTQIRCYHGADGVKQEVPITAAPEPEKKRGLRGRIIENKKEALSDYMKQAVALVKSYLPPEPERIQAVKDAGKVSITPLEPGKRVRLDFKDYLKAGDTLSVEVSPADNRLLVLKVNTWLEDPAEVVTLDVRLGTLDDGTTYPQAASLDATSKGLKVDVANSGYLKH